jgi:hypothetical protein
LKSVESLDTLFPLFTPLSLIIQRSDFITQRFFHEVIQFVLISVKIALKECVTADALLFLLAFFYDKYLIHQNKLDLMRDYEFIFDRFSPPLLTRLSPYIMQYFRVYIQRHEELTTQCCDEIWKCDHKKIKQKKMLMKIQSCVYDGGSKS